jgi:hypothetical protein
MELHGPLRVVIFQGLVHASGHVRDIHDQGLAVGAVKKTGVAAGDGQNIKGPLPGGRAHQGLDAKPVAHHLMGNRGPVQGQGMEGVG